MARKTPRKMGRYIKGDVEENLDLGTLAAATLVSALFDSVVDDRTLVSSIVATWSMTNFTPIAEVGPIVVGVAHSDYSDAEIEAWLEATGSWNEGDKVAQEVTKRLIRKIGVFAESESALIGETLNEGKAIRTRLNWMLAEGQTLRLWAYNSGSAAVATTDPNVRLSGHANLWPR